MSTPILTNRIPDERLVSASQGRRAGASPVGRPAQPPAAKSAPAAHPPLLTVIAAEVAEAAEADAKVVEMALALQPVLVLDGRERLPAAWLRLADGLRQYMRVSIPTVPAVLDAVLAMRQVSKRAFGRDPVVVIVLTEVGQASRLDQMCPVGTALIRLPAAGPAVFDWSPAAASPARRHSTCALAEASAVPAEHNH